MCVAKFILYSPQLPYIRLLQVDVLVDEYNRFPRRVAAVQITRHWDDITSIARNKKIPLGDVAVRIVCTTFPFQTPRF